MFVKLIAKSNFDGELYKTHFKNGASLEHVNQDTFDRLATLALEPQWIPVEQCPNCAKLRDEILNLKAELSIKKSKKPKE
jgi:hypothetical protein